MVSTPNRNQLQRVSFVEWQKLRQRKPWYREPMNIILICAYAGLIALCTVFLLNIDKLYPGGDPRAATFLRPTGVDK